MSQCASKQPRSVRSAQATRPDPSLPDSRPLTAQRRVVCRMVLAAEGPFWPFFSCSFFSSPWQLSGFLSLVVVLLSRLLAFFELLPVFVSFLWTRDWISAASRPLLRQLVSSLRRDFFFCRAADRCVFCYRSFYPAESVRSFVFWDRCLLLLDGASSRAGKGRQRMIRLLAGKLRWTRRASKTERRRAAEEEGREGDGGWAEGAGEEEDK